ncbi:GYDIA family GHMP kinase [Membranihabitans marinus]
MALSAPLKWGQTMKVTESSGSDLRWVTLDHEGKKWFECILNLIDFSIEKTNDEEKAKFIQQLVTSLIQLNSDFLSKWKKYKVDCVLEFNPAWGFGSSSTLITNLATWAEVSPFELFFETQVGSGFDIASAMADAPILYQKDDESLTFEEIDLSQVVIDHSVVFYRGNKVNSHGAVEKWKMGKKVKSVDIDQMNSLSNAITNCNSVSTYQDAVKEHELLVKKYIDVDCIQSQFSDYEGTMKSLGAWGGDFGLAVHEDADYTLQYLKTKGIDTAFKLGDILLT